MSPVSIFHLIAEIVQNNNVSCVVIGGYAVNHYKVARQTADIDFLITQEDLKKILSSLETAGYKLGESQENFAHFTGGQLSFMDIDFMFVDRETLEKITAEAQELKIAGQSFLVPSLYHLIALKLHSIKFNRKSRILKDFPDIVNLIRVNKIDIREEEFQKMCLKYGDQNLWDQIQEAAG
ncbi:MAG: nucleotidyltransferase [Candidatus Omnitrophica bacterium]|nr:nucleotidyltransferase [Candidatus Omnitrophota bacterium]